MLKAHPNLWEHWRRNSENRVLGGDDRRGNDWAATLKDGWLLAGGRRPEVDSMKRQQCPLRDVMSGWAGGGGMGSAAGERWVPRSMQHLGCGRGREAIRVDWRQHGIDLEFNPKEIPIHRQWREMIKKKNYEQTLQHPYGSESSLTSVGFISIELSIEQLPPSFDSG